MADPVTITVSGATLALVAERVFALFIAPRLRPKEDSASSNSSSGQKDPAFWKQEFRSAIDEKLEQRIIPILENQQKILESQARTQEGVALLVKELVDISRKRRR
jgi:hypothetical protein